MVAVTLTCMTKKEKFDVEDPNVVVLKNGRFAYKARCPWMGKENQTLYVYKFCSRDAHVEYEARVKAAAAADDPAVAEEEPAVAE